MSNGTCSAFVWGDALCRNGFPQKPFCRGYAGCPTCGNISARSIPNCLDDDFAPPHLIDGSGYPKFATKGRHP